MAETDRHPAAPKPTRRSPYTEKQVLETLAEFSPTGLESWLRSEGISQEGAKLLVSMLDAEDHGWLAALRLLFPVLGRKDFNPLVEIPVRVYLVACRAANFTPPVAMAGLEAWVNILAGRFYTWVRDIMLPAVESRAVGARVGRVDGTGRRVEEHRVPKEALLRRLFLDKVSPQIPDAHTGAALRRLFKLCEKVLPTEFRDRDVFTQEVESIIALERGKRFIFQKADGAWDWSWTALRDAMEKHHHKLAKEILTGEPVEPKNADTKDSEQVLEDAKLLAILPALLDFCRSKGPAHVGAFARHFGRPDPANPDCMKGSLKKIAKTLGVKPKAIRHAEAAVYAEARRLMAS